MRTLLKTAEGVKDPRLTDKEYKEIHAELVRNTKMSGFCTGECGTTEAQCKQCKKDYIESGLEWSMTHKEQRKQQIRWWKLFCKAADKKRSLK